MLISCHIRQTLNSIYESFTLWLYVNHPFTQWDPFHFLSLLFLDLCISVQNNKLHGVVLVRGNTEAERLTTKKKLWFLPAAVLPSITCVDSIWSFFLAALLVWFQRLSDNFQLWPIWKEITKSCLIWCDSQVTMFVLTVELLVSTLTNSLSIKYVLLSIMIGLKVNDDCVSVCMQTQGFSILNNKQLHKQVCVK